MTGTPKSAIAKGMESLPAFPVSVQRVLEMTGHIDCMPKDLVAVLEKDPVLTGRILNLVNSAYFSLARRVGSIRHALVYLGLNTIKHLAMGLAAVGAMPNIQRDGLSMVTFQSDALACGEATRIAGRHLMVVGSDQDHLYLLGLFHNLGDVICAAYAPDEWTHYQSRKYSNQEEMDSSATELFGATPREIGAEILRKWEMPESMAAALANYPFGNTLQSEDVFATALWTGSRVLEEVLPPGHPTVLLSQNGPKRAEQIVTNLLEYPHDVLHSVEQAKRFLLEA